MQDHSASFHDLILDMADDGSAANDEAVVQVGSSKSLRKEKRGLRVPAAMALVTFINLSTKAGSIVVMH